MTQISDVPYQVSDGLRFLLLEFARQRNVAKKTFKPTKRRAPSYFGWSRKEIFAEKCRLVHVLHDPKIGEGMAVLPGVQLPSKRTHKGASMPMHTAILIEAERAKIGLRVTDEIFGKMFDDPKRADLRRLMTEQECASIYGLYARYEATLRKLRSRGEAKKDLIKKLVRKQEEARGRIVRAAMARVIREAMYTPADAPLYRPGKEAPQDGTVVKVRNDLAFITSLPSIAKIRIIKVRKYDDDDRHVKGRRANKNASK